MRVQRVYHDEQGESHVEIIDWEMTSEIAAAGSPSIDISQTFASSKVNVMRAPGGWQGDWHPAPNRQLMCYLSGQAERETSDGVTMTMRSGTIVLLEDTEGKGHRSRVLGDEEVIIAVVQLEPNK